jgi:hypothetical protein
MHQKELAVLFDVNGVNAPDGIVGPHREKEGSFYAIKEIYSPVKITLKELPENFMGEVPVENRYHFTNLSQCTFSFELLNFLGREDLTGGYTVVKTGKVKSPSIAPVAKGTLKMDLPADWKNHDALALTAFDTKGNEIYKWTWKIKSNAELIKPLLTASTTEAVNFAESDTTITLKANGIAATFDKKDGKLSGLANDYSAKLSFKNGPVLVSGNAEFKELKHFKDGESYVVEAFYTGNMNVVRWKMNPSGWLELSYEYNLNGTYQFAGISFDYPENFVLGAKWLGKGPSRVWKNRLQGTNYNVWQNRNNSTHTGSAPWIYPEFKGYFADVTWMELNTVEGKFTIASPDTDLFVRLFDFYGLSGAKPHPVLPLGDISFLDRIPPIGTKLALNINQKTSNLGPSSEPNTINGITKRTLYFYFGLPKPSSENRQFAMPKENILTD